MIAGAKELKNVRYSVMMPFLLLDARWKFSVLNNMEKMLNLALKINNTGRNNCDQGCHQNISKSNKLFEKITNV